MSFWMEGAPPKNILRHYQTKFCWILCLKNLSFIVYIKMHTLIYTNSHQPTIIITTVRHSSYLISRVIVLFQIRMGQCLFYSNPFVGVKSQHLVEQVQCYNRVKKTTS